MFLDPLETHFDIFAFVSNFSGGEIKRESPNRKRNGTEAFNPQYSTLDHDPHNRINNFLDLSREDPVNVFG